MSPSRPSLADRAWRLALVVAYRLLRVYWFAFRPRTRGVFVALWHDARLLVVRHSYKPLVSLPAGYVKRGEDPRHTAEREVSEEVGIRIPAGALRFVSETVSRFEFKWDHVRIYEIELESAPAVEIDRREIVWADFRTAREALDLDLDPRVRAYVEERSNREPGG